MPTNDPPSIRERHLFEASVLAAIVAIEGVEALLKLFDKPGILKALDTLANALRSVPPLLNDLSIARSRLRALLASDPDKTPRHGISSSALRAMAVDKTKLPPTS
jgi:hypothetical protein